MTAECERRGWTLIGVVSDAGASGRSLARRPALADALERLDSGDADCFMVSKLDRLSRSLLDFAGLMARLSETDGTSWPSISASI